MKISNLIKNLQEIKKDEGDLNVFIERDRGGSDFILELTPFKNTKFLTFKVRPDLK